VGGVTTQLAGPVEFNVVLDPQGTLTLADHSARGAFQEKYQAVRRSVAGSLELANATNARLDQIKRALDQTPAAPPALQGQARELQRRLGTILVALRGDQALRSRQEATPPSISERVNTIASQMARTLQPATSTNQQQLAIAGELYAAEQTKLKQLVQTDIPALERELEKAGAPYTAGRVPEAPEP
jgi:chromosome segregation ATPase